MFDFIDPTKLLIVGAFGFVGLLYLLSIKPDKMSTIYALLILAFLAVELNRLLPYRATLLNMRWIELPVFSLYAVVMLSQRTRLVRMDAASILYLLFSLLAFVSAYTVSHDPGITLLKSITLLMLYVAVFVGLRAYANAFDHATRAIAENHGRILAIVAVLSGIQFVFARGQSLLGGWFRGPFNNPNFMGVVLAGFLPFLFWNYMYPPAGKRKRMYLALVIAAGAMLVMTNSRASLFALMLSVGICLVFFNRRWLPAVIGAGAAGLVFMYASSVFNVNLEGRQSLIETLVFKQQDRIMGKQREESFNVTMNNFKNNPIFGVGFGVTVDSRVAQDKYLHLGFVQKREKGNSYLALGEEMGFVGGAPLLLFLLVVATGAVGALRAGYRKLPHNDPEVVLLLVYFTSNLALMANAFFEAWLIAVGNPITLFFYGNMILMLVQSERVRRRALQGVAAQPAEQLPVSLPTAGMVHHRPQRQGGFTY